MNMTDINSIVSDVAGAIVGSREFCGDEREAARECLAGYRIPMGSPRGRDILAAARRLAESTWADYQREAGVVAPISAEERATITRIMERAP
jgi:hypothetical protein